MQRRTASNYPALQCRNPPASGCVPISKRVYVLASHPMGKRSCQAKTPTRPVRPIIASCTHRIDAPSLPLPAVHHPHPIAFEPWRHDLFDGNQTRMAHGSLKG
jgi:hypothetical protein